MHNRNNVRLNIGLENQIINSLLENNHQTFPIFGIYVTRQCYNVLKQTILHENIMKSKKIGFLNKKMTLTEIAILKQDYQWILYIFKNYTTKTNILRYFQHITKFKKVLH